MRKLLLLTAFVLSSASLAKDGIEPILTAATPVSVNNNACKGYPISEKAYSVPFSAPALLQQVKAFVKFGPQSYSDLTIEEYPMYSATFVAYTYIEGGKKDIKSFWLLASGFSGPTLVCASQ